MYDKDWLLQRLYETRDRTLALVDTLSDDQLQVPYHPGVNPPLWEMGHSSFFYEVFVLNLLDGTPSYDPSMDDLWDSFHIEHHDRWNRELFPGREQTREYMLAIYDLIARRIREQPLDEYTLYLYRYAIYHQHMHIESMTWCRQTVGYPAPPAVADPLSDALADEPEALGDAEIPAGTWQIGMPGKSASYARDDFAFDGEKPRHEVTLDAFRISRTLVSNGEFLAFVEDGGYRRPELWSFGGRKWLQTETDVALVYDEREPVLREPRHPLYWRLREGQWQQKLFDHWRPLDRNAPVLQLCYWEAEAWCNWAGRRLPTEAEWEVAALGNRSGEPFQTVPLGQ